MASGSEPAEAELERIRRWRQDLIDQLPVDVRVVAAGLWPHREQMHALLRLLHARGGNIVESMGLRLFWEHLTVSQQSDIPHYPSTNEGERPCQSP